MKAWVWIGLAVTSGAVASGLGAQSAYFAGLRRVKPADESAAEVPPERRERVFWTWAADPDAPASTAVSAFRADPERFGELVRRVAAAGDAEQVARAEAFARSAQHPEAVRALVWGAEVAAARGEAERAARWRASAQAARRALERASRRAVRAP